MHKKPWAKKRMRVQSDLKTTIASAIFSLFRSLLELKQSFFFREIATQLVRKLFNYCRFYSACCPPECFSKPFQEFPGISQGLSQFQIANKSFLLRRIGKCFCFRKTKCAIFLRKPLSFLLKVSIIHLLVLAGFRILLS